VYYSQGTLEGDVVAGDAVNGLVRDDRLAVLEPWGDVGGFPLDGCLFAIVLSD